MTQEPTYLTYQGQQDLQAELDDLTNNRRTAIAKRLRFAIEQGDLSENADYTAAKEEQAFTEGRIRELETLLGNVVLIDDVQREKGAVNIGSTVLIAEDGEDPEEYRIVGSQESDPAQGKISFRSPIGAALFGKKVGDVVTAQVPNGEIKFKILEIRES